MIRSQSRSVKLSFTAVMYLSLSIVVDLCLGSVRVRLAVILCLFCWCQRLLCLVSALCRWSCDWVVVTRCGAPDVADTYSQIVFHCIGHILMKTKCV